MFSTLEPSPEVVTRRGVAILGGILLEVITICATILIAIMFPQELPLSKRYMLAWLPSLTPPKPPVTRPAHKVPHVVVPRVKLADPLELPPPPVAELKTPKAPPLTMPLPVPPMPAPPVAEPPPPPKPKEPIVVQTGLFGGAPEKVTTKRPANQVQTGGFGDPQGFKGQAKGDSAGNVPKLGSFGLPEGPGVGNGTGGRHGIQGVVASAGFGSGVAGGGDGSRVSGGPGGVSLGGFEQTRQTAAPAEKKAPEPPPSDFQPVEILFKPSPVYTEEARRLGIQGEVVLSVVFQANGAIKLNGVVRSLGHGLDKAAEQAAAQIRFKPAQRAGQATDFPANLRIEFRLADQSS